MRRRPCAARQWKDCSGSMVVVRPTREAPAHHRFLETTRCPWLLVVYFSGEISGSIIAITAMTAIPPQRFFSLQIVPYPRSALVFVRKARGFLFRKYFAREISDPSFSNTRRVGRGLPSPERQQEGANAPSSPSPSVAQPRPFLPCGSFELGCLLFNPLRRPGSGCSWQIFFSRQHPKWSLTLLDPKVKSAPLHCQKCPKRLRGATQSRHESPPWRHPPGLL